MSSLSQVLSRAVRFLLDRQDREGGWRDFDLAPGVATSWTTAYVAARIEAAKRLEPEAGAAADRAARFLSRSREPGGGWAYNARCPADANSTALALLFLAGRDPAPRLKDAAVLAAFQTQDGGFATYRPWRVDHPWAEPAAEVTATALRALGMFLPASHSILERGRAWLAGRVAQGDGGYWWTTPAYLDLELTRLGVAPPDRMRNALPADAFTLALHLEIAALRGRRSDPAPLIAMQQSDGGWPSHPTLRLPDRIGAPGPSLHADQRRLFTTATALSALLAVDGDHGRPPVNAADLSLASPSIRLPPGPRRRPAPPPSRRKKERRATSPVPRGRRRWLKRLRFSLLPRSNGGGEGN